ncbi:hypothetical protein [Sphingobacterium sp.]|uniref:hypothetical protein n=1 Tax=Sphingobacterium sp. TaxID=341027 RepID=UPI00338F9253
MSRYNDPIAANVVIGTTVFSDIGASYVDFFVGRSSSCPPSIFNYCTYLKSFLSSLQHNGINSICEKVLN